MAIGGWGGTEDGGAGWGCWRWELDRTRWGGREIGFSPAELAGAELELADVELPIGPVVALCSGMGW